ncbi:polysaccharide lyase family 7 protein [Spirochaetia bacterium 38H-sp]|uniref:Polysaccharide lyase family 7 protein n=1 Tax=Rarispira pelagica TaxID=3141764 RepID=A0ABU9UAQ7_9SPIR
MKKALGVLLLILLISSYVFSTGNQEQSSPSELLDFTTWKLQLPVANESKTMVKEVYPEELMAGYKDEYFYLDKKENAVVFRSPVEGFKTPNTTYTRSELRELIDGKNNTVNWGFTGTHIMRVTESVGKVPSTGKVIVAQIHSIYPNGDNGPATIKVEYDGIEKLLAVKVKVASDKDAGEEKFYFKGIELNQKFDLEIKIIGGIFYAIVSSDGKTASYSYPLLPNDPNWTEFLNYFKVGCYTQDSKADSPDEEGMVRLYRLETFHSDKVEEVKIKGLKVEPEEITLARGETAQLHPVFEPIETTDRNVTYQIIDGKGTIALNKDGIITAIKEGIAHIKVISNSNTNITAQATITVSQAVEKTASLLYQQNFENTDLSAPEFSISNLGSANVNINNGILQITDNDPSGKGILGITFPKQNDTVTISLRIRLDRVDVKEKGTSKAQGSYLYVVMGGKDEGFLATSDEMFRIRNKSTYRGEELFEHRWVLTTTYMEPDINPEAAKTEIGKWMNVTIITTPNNGTAKANTTDVYMNGIKVGEGIKNNKVSDFINQLNIYSGTKDLIDFSIDDIEIYAGEKIPESENNTAPEKILLGVLPSYMAPGDSVKIDAMVMPKGSYEVLTYTSLSEDIAAVSNQGFVTAISPGSGIIRVASKIDSQIYTDYRFKVLSPQDMVRVKDIVLPEKDITIKIGEKTNINASVTPSIATEPSLKYEIAEGAEHITIDQDGTVTAIKPGKAVIRIISLDNQKISQKCIVKVISDKEAGTILYQTDFSSSLGDEWRTSADNNTECAIEDGALHLKDNNIGGQPKAYITFEPQADTFTVQFRIKVIADPIYDETKVSAVTCGIGSEKVTSTANQAFRFKTSASVENGELTDRRFIYSISEKDYDRVPGNYELNKWYTVAITITPDNGTPRANTADIYIDGKKLVSDAPNRKAMAVIDKVVFQSGTKDLTEYYIDDLKIWTGDYNDR